MFAGFVACMGDTRLPKCVMFGELVGARGLREGAGKRVSGVFLDDLIAFDIDAEQCTTAAQDEGEWRRTVEQGAERFMAKLITACSSMPERDGKDQGKDIAQSKRVRAGSFAIVD